MNAFLFLQKGCIDIWGAEGRGGEGLGVVPKREPPDLRSLEVGIFAISKFKVFIFMPPFYTI